MATYGPTSVSRDAWIFELSPTFNYGAAVYLDIGWAATGQKRNTCLTWDVSTIPTGAIVSAASVVISYQAEALSTDRAGTLYPCTRLITEGTGNGSATGDGATWNTYDGSSAWTAAGGDIDASFGSAFTLTNSTADLTIDATTAVSKALSDYRSGNFITLMAMADVNLVATGEFWRGDHKGTTPATLSVTYTLPTGYKNLLLLGVG